MNIYIFFLIVPVLEFAKWRSLKVKSVVYNINPLFVDLFRDTFGILEISFIWTTRKPIHF